MKDTEYDDDDDRGVNRPLDVRYVIVGLSLMIASLGAMVLVEVRTVRIICGVCLAASVFIMTKRQAPQL